MTDITKGNVSIIITMKAPTEEGADACRNFLEGHCNMMETKSHRNGDFEFIKYYSSEGPEYLDEGENQLAWYGGRYRKKTGRTIFVITEIYKKKEGLFNHFIESKELANAGASIMELNIIEYNQISMTKVKHSLWDQYSTTPSAAHLRTV